MVFMCPPIAVAIFIKEVPDLHPRAVVFYETVRIAYRAREWMTVTPQESAGPGKLTFGFDGIPAASWR